MSNTMKFLGVAGLLALSLAFAGVSAQPSADGREVVESACNNCHSYGRICLNLGRDADWWNKTTRRMIKNGAPINSAQAEAAASFLALLEPGSEPVCN